VTKHPNAPVPITLVGKENRHQHGAEAPHEHPQANDERHRHGAGPWSGPEGAVPFNPFSEPGPYSSSRRSTHPFETA